MREEKRFQRNILAGQGREWSAVASEFDGIYRQWLTASQLSEEDFLASIEREEMYLTFSADDEMAVAAFCQAQGEIGAPLVWERDSGIPFASYQTDAALFLLYVAGKCQRQGSKDKIERFVKRELLGRRG